MSLDAICWVQDQDIKPSSVKAVLMTLADECIYSPDNEDAWMVCVSVESICYKTSQDRKTVISAIQRLQDWGILHDTGKREGRTKQIKIYEMKKNNEVSE